MGKPLPRVAGVIIYACMSALYPLNNLLNLCCWFSSFKKWTHSHQHIRFEYCNSCLNQTYPIHCFCSWWWWNIIAFCVLKDTMLVPRYFKNKETWKTWQDTVYIVKKWAYVIKIEARGLSVTLRDLCLEYDSSLCLSSALLLLQMMNTDGRIINIQSNTNF